MVHLGLVLAAALAGQAAGAGDVSIKDSAAIATESPDQQKALAEYNAMREKTGNSASAHWRLALWCEKNGLKAEAYAHYGEVARLDPKREAVWRKLGFKKLNGRWTTDAMIAEEKQQAAAEKLWGSRLKKVHKDIHGTNGTVLQEQAQAELDAIRDPRAALPMYRQFGRGKLDQSILIPVLEQLNSPNASNLLAFLAVYGAAPEVRKQATLALRQRPEADYLGFLVSLMVDPLSFEVRHVGGPGSPGAIFVEGERFDSLRFYAPPSAPYVTPMPGDIIALDGNGQPSIARPTASISATTMKGVPGSKTLVEQTTSEQTEYAVISPAQLQREAQRGAASAEAQLRADERQMRAINTSRRQFNDLVMAVARDASGKDLGTTPKEWREGLVGMNKQSPRTQPQNKPTVTEEVPLAYNPWFGPVGVFTQTMRHTQIVVDS